MSTKSNLIKYTKVFFERHWNSKIIGENFDNEWLLYSLIGEIHYNDKPGCYAFIKEKEVVYIGSGVSRGSGIYESHGIGKRINHYIKWKREKGEGSIADRRYVFKEEWENKADSIYTLGLPKDYSYMVLSLEGFLISKLNPRYNLQKVKSTK